MLFPVIPTLTWLVYHPENLAILRGISSATIRTLSTAGPDEVRWTSNSETFPTWKKKSIFSTSGLNMAISPVTFESYPRFWVANRRVTPLFQANHDVHAIDHKFHSSVDNHQFFLFVEWSMSKLKTHRNNSRVDVLWMMKKLPSCISTDILNR